MASGSTKAVRDSYFQRQMAALMPFAIWGAYLLAFAAHIVVRSYADALFSAHSPGRLDQAMTGTVPSGWLQDRFYGRVFVLDRVATGAHLVWYAFPFVVGFIVTLRQRQLLASYLSWLTVTWFLADVIFLLVPTQPPWMVDSQVTRLLFTRGWVDYAGADTNPVAAFPSLHAGIPLVMGLFVWTRWKEARILAAICFGYALLVGFSVVYLGEHWVVDVFGGYGLALAVLWLFTSERSRAWVAMSPRRLRPVPSAKIVRLDGHSAVDDHAA